MSNNFYDEKGSIDLTDKEQAEFWEKQAIGLSKTMSDYKSIIQAKTKQKLELETRNAELEELCKRQSDDLDKAGNELFLQEGKIKELEEKFKESFEAGQASAIPRIRELEKKLEIAVEALESVAFMDEPEADTKEYWENEELIKIPETMALDTRICREALAAIKGASNE